MSLKDDPRMNQDGSEESSSQQPNDGRGRNKPAGPPEMEEVLRDFNQRLQSLLGGGSGGGGGSGQGSDPNPLSPKLMGGGMVVIVIILLALWLASGFYTVDQSERAIVLRLGKPQATTGAGLRWHFPYPIETHEKVNIAGVRVVEVGYRGETRNQNLDEALMVTGDMNIINIQFAVQYILKDPEDYLFNNRHPDNSVSQAAETAMREIVGKNTMDFVLYEGREEIGASAHELMQIILDRYKTGVQISRVTMQNVQPPEQVQAAFDDAVKAGQDLERQRNEGEAYANNVVPRARGTAARMVEEANAYRERVVANAEGESSRFSQVYQQFMKAPEVTRNRLYLETMQDVYTNSSKVFVDAQGGNNVMLMPLDRLLSSAGAAARGGSATMVQPPVQHGVPLRPAPAASEDGASPRDRDFLRNRNTGGLR